MGRGCGLTVLGFVALWGAFAAIAGAVALVGGTHDDFTGIVFVFLTLLAGYGAWRWYHHD